MKPFEHEGQSGKSGPGSRSLTARVVVEGARRMARASRDAMLPVIKASGAINAHQLIEQRMEIVADAYLTGAAEILKMLRGDFEPEPWGDDYQHEPRIAELLALAQPQPSEATATPLREKQDFADPEAHEPASIDWDEIDAARKAKESK